MHHSLVGLCELARCIEANPTSRFPFEVDVGLGSVEPQTDGFELSLEKLALLAGLCAVQHHNDQVGRLCNCNDLPASSFSLRCTLDDSWQIQQLDV